MSATARKLRKARQRWLVEAAVRVQGCACDIAIEHTGPSWAKVRHDEGCHLIGIMGQIVVDLAPPARCSR